MSIGDFFRSLFSGNAREQPLKKTSFRSAKPPHIGPSFGGMGMQGAATDRFTSSWTTNPLEAYEIVRRFQRTLVARSREQALNNDYAKKFLGMVQRNVIGPNGIGLQVKCRGIEGELEIATNDAIEDAFDEWGKKGNCDVTGRLSWLAIQRLFMRTVAKDGEAVAVVRYGKNAGPWGFSLQLVDPQRIPVHYDEVRLPNGNIIRHGIEMTDLGRVVAYYFDSMKESDSGYLHRFGPWVRIPAENVIHCYVEEMPGQFRGLPWMETALWRMRMLAGYEDAAITNARVAASKMGFFSPKYTEDMSADEIKDLAIDAEPGTFEFLPAEFEFKEFNPQYPQGEFPGFIKACLRAISAGLGVSYNNLANDLEGVNFSSIRHGALDERDTWMEIQSWLIDNFHQIVYEKWLDVALLSKRIAVEGKPLPAQNAKDYLHVSWQGRRWPWVDPEKDVDAAVKSMESLIRAPGDVIRESGRDPEDVWREIARDLEKMEKCGIPRELVQKILVKGGGKSANGGTSLKTEPDPPGAAGGDKGN